MRLVLIDTIYKTYVSLLGYVHNTHVGTLQSENTNFVDLGRGHTFLALDRPKNVLLLYTVECRHIPSASSMTVPQREGGAPLGEEETPPRVWKDRRMPALRKFPNIFSLSHQVLLRVEISRSSSIWEGRSR